MTFTHYSVDACLLAEKPCTLSIQVSLLQLVDSKSVGDAACAAMELRLPQLMFAAYSNQVQYQNQSFNEQRVVDAKYKHVRAMIDAVAESVILWMCMENNVERASVVPV